MKKKIGITTFYDAYNYGAFLQCFALQQALKKYDAKIIKYTSNKIKKDYSLIKYKNWKLFLKSIVFFNKNYKKQKAFKNSIGKYFNFGSLNERYDIVIAGSDQIWNPILTDGFDGVYTLNKFKEAIKISYASSIGDETLIDSYTDEYKEIINNIDYVSVREESTAKKLEKISKKNVTVNLDPTLLLTKSEWEKYIDKSKTISNSIFSYFVAVTDDNYNFLRQLSKKTNYGVLSYSENPKEYNIIKKCYSDGPFDFIQNIYSSSIVFTSSFHGTVFSILFHKKFYVMLPKKKANRIVDLLKKLDLTDRIVSIDGYNNIDSVNINDEIDYDQVDKKLSYYRNLSIKWINEVIERGKNE